MAVRPPTFVGQISKYSIIDLVLCYKKENYFKFKVRLATHSQLMDIVTVKKPKPLIAQDLGLFVLYNLFLNL